MRQPKNQLPRRPRYKKSKSSMIVPPWPRNQNLHRMSTSKLALPHGAHSMNCRTGYASRAPLQRPKLHLPIQARNCPLNKLQPLQNRRSRHLRQLRLLMKGLDPAVRLRPNQYHLERQHPRSSQREIHLLVPLQPHRKPVTTARSTILAINILMREETAQRARQLQLQPPRPPLVIKRPLFLRHPPHLPYKNPFSRQ